MEISTKQLRMSTLSPVVTKHKDITRKGLKCQKVTLGGMAKVDKYETTISSPRSEAVCPE